MREFSVGELNDYLGSADDRPLLLDVREPWEFEKASIEGSTLVPMRSIPTRVNEFDSNQEIVVICHHGIRSRMVCQFLESQHFTNVINLSGGIAAWAQNVDQRMATY